MGLFDIFKKSTKPYKTESLNQIYQLLFCDNLGLFKSNINFDSKPPWDILFSEPARNADLKILANDIKAESRTRVLAYNKLLAAGQKVKVKELLAVIVEVGLENGLDVLASFSDGSARYINQTEKIIVWETANVASSVLTNQLFKDSARVITQIGPWNKPRSRRSVGIACARGICACKAI